MDGGSRYFETGTVAGHDRSLIASFALLALAMKSLPLGTAYTIWTGIGAVGAFIVGITVLGEQASAMRIVAALLIVSGLVLMKWSSPA